MGISSCSCLPSLILQTNELIKTNRKPSDVFALNANPDQNPIQTQFAIPVGTRRSAYHMAEPVMASTVSQETLACLGSAEMDQMPHVAGEYSDAMDDTL